MEPTDPILTLLFSVAVAVGALKARPEPRGEPITITLVREGCNHWPETITPLLEQMNAVLGVNWVHVPCSGRAASRMRTS